MKPYYRYGITLEPLSEMHLEMVRQWRNSELVRSRMHFREIIAEEEQIRWFAGLDRDSHYYFIGIMDNEPIGLFHIKNVNRDESLGEAGAFVSDARFIGSKEAAFAILALMDFAFFELKLTALEAKYNPSFHEIDMLNRKLGYETIASEADGFVRARVNAERYFAVTGSLRKAAETLSARLPSS